MRLDAHRRSRDVEPDPEAEQAAREAQAELAAAYVKAATALARLDLKRSYLLSGFVSVHAWAADAGYGPRERQRLLALGRALREAPELHEAVRAGQVPSESAIAVGRVLREPLLSLSPEERAQWIKNATALPPELLRREAEKIVEDARQGAPTHSIRFHVTMATRDDFRLSRTLMSRGRTRPLPEGEVFRRLILHWLARHDPKRRPLPKRGCGPTAGSICRHVPEQVKAIIARRSGGLCEICGVRIAVERIHIQKSHREGGSREAENIADSCYECHVLADSGAIAFSRFDEEGHPRWKRNDQEVRETPPPAYGPRPSLATSGAFVTIPHTRDALRPPRGSPPPAASP